MKIDVKSTETVMDGSKTPTAWHQNANRLHRLTPLRNLLRPFHICMAVAGLYTYDNDVIKTGRKTPKGWRCWIIGNVYRSFILLVGLQGFVKHCVAFVTLSSSSWRFNIMVLAYTVNSVLGLLIFLKSNHTKYGNHGKAYDFWDDKVLPALDELEIDFPEEKIKRRLRIYLILILFCCVCNTVGIALLATETLSSSLGVVLTAPFGISTAAKLYEISTLAIMSLLWFIPIFYVTLISTLMMSTFEVFNQYLETHIAENCFEITCKFQKMRQLHLNLSKMVSELDKDLKYYYAIVVVCNVGLSSFILYHIIKTPMGTLDFVMFLFWQTIIITSVGVPTVHAALVNEAAHGALDSVYFICMKDLSTVQHGQQIAGVFLTYFFLLYTM